MIVLKNILVATDFEPASDAALTYGRALARTFGARLHLLHGAANDFLRASVTDSHVPKTTVARRLNERLTAEDRADRGALATLDVSDQPADAITRYAKHEQIDLIVRGTHGCTGVTHMLINGVAEHVVRTAPCRVPTVRHPEHEFVLPDAAPAISEMRPS